MPRALSSALLLGLALCGGENARAARPSPPAVVTYDSFMKTERPPRGPAFSRLPAESRGEIMKTHMRRWQAAHEARLRPEQKALIALNLATLTADFYREPTTKEWRDKAIELFRRAEKVFSKEEMVQLFTLDGDYLPPEEGER